MIRCYVLLIVYCVCLECVICPCVTARVFTAITSLYILWLCSYDSILVSAPFTSEGHERGEVGRVFVYRNNGVRDTWACVCTPHTAMHSVAFSEG